MSSFEVKTRSFIQVMDVGWMFSGWSSTPARGPQDGPNVHHGFIFDVTITYFCIRSGFTDETISVLHVFG
jgi:hypothetical protein